ncbi:WD40 repeat domain-containing protein, partial [Candidatus Bathyarchaeota archaeon]|nr:WD40 repeat domain-containing protein [Candidatus Bathyarchaeota archaeon]
MVANPAGLPRPKSIIFLEMGDVVLMGSGDRCVRTLGVDDDFSGWEVKIRIEDEVLDTLICSALSPDGEMIAFGYRGLPVTVWQVSSNTLVKRCDMTPLDGALFHEGTEISQLAWHPFSGEVFGVQCHQSLFKWDLYDDNASVQVQTDVIYLAVSPNGLFVATTHSGGTVRVFTVASLTLIYKLDSEMDGVNSISFST